MEAPATGELAVGVGVRAGTGVTLVLLLLGVSGLPGRGLPPTPTGGLGRDLESTPLLGAVVAVPPPPPPSSTLATLGEPKSAGTDAQSMVNAKVDEFSPTCHFDHCKHQLIIVQYSTSKQSTHTHNC